MTSDILYNDEILFCTDIGPTGIIATFEDKHREKASFFCPSEFFLDYSRAIKQLVPACEYTPAVLITSDEEDEE
jgi:hypothetical protein